MSRPEVSVVMPFGAGPDQAQGAIDALRSLCTSPGDELILVDNVGSVNEAEGVTVLRAWSERSPAHARNEGAALACGDWILFLDADCTPPPGLLDAYFGGPVADDVGAVVGEVRPAPGEPSLAGRYGAARSFLGQQVHLEHPFRPRAAAANLLVRRSAFEQLGGFFEGLRAAEDTDFSWRLQEAGWRLEFRPEAWVEHHYRSTLRDLRRQWRGYAAGRAWLARRYEAFEPRPALARAAQRTRARLTGSSPAPRGSPPAQGPRGSFLALDALLSLEELVGFALSNRPRPETGVPARAPGAPVRASSGAPAWAPGAPARASSRAPARASLGAPTRPSSGAPGQGPQVVLVADRFPARDDPLVELAVALERVRVEALARPRVPDQAAIRRLSVDYLEDDGLAARLSATATLALRHPLRSLRDRLRQAPADPPLRQLAPAVLRLERDPRAPVRSLGGERAHRVAARLAALAGRELGG